MKNKKFLSLFLLFAATMLFFGCSKDEEEEEGGGGQQVDVNETSIMPSSEKGRPNNNLGCVEISSRITTIEVWDHGLIDGDIVSIIANGETIINEEELDGPANPITVSYDFKNNGFNYVTLFAHNLGDVAPNTCTMAINGVEFILSANLDANGSVDVVVTGYGVSCDGADNGDGDGNNNGGNGTGDVKFWLSSDLGCGYVDVTVDGVGTSTISGYFGSAPECSDTAYGGNFSDLPAGNYTYAASCQGMNWNGDFTIEEGGCLRFELY